MFNSCFGRKPLAVCGLALACGVLAAKGWSADAEGGHGEKGEKGKKENPEKKIVFKEDIWPIFHRRCVECHGPDKQKEELRLDTPEFIMKGGEHGPVLVAGQPEKSAIVKKISLPEKSDGIMPAEGKPLNKNQIEKIRTWIAQGAEFGEWKGMKDKDTTVHPEIPKKEKHGKKTDAE